MTGVLILARDNPSPLRRNLRQPQERRDEQGDDRHVEAGERDDVIDAGALEGALEIVRQVLPLPKEKSGEDRGGSLPSRPGRAHQARADRSPERRQEAAPRPLSRRHDGDEARTLDRPDQLDASRPQVGRVVERAGVSEGPRLRQACDDLDEVARTPERRSLVGEDRDRQPEEYWRARGPLESRGAREAVTLQPEEKSGAPVGKGLLVEEPPAHADRRRAGLEPMAPPQAQEPRNRIGHGVEPGGNPAREKGEKEDRRPEGPPPTRRELQATGAIGKEQDERAERGEHRRDRGGSLVGRDGPGVERGGDEERRDPGA